jgi:hypothetical protein
MCVTSLIDSTDGRQEVVWLKYSGHERSSAVDRRLTLQTFCLILGDTDAFMGNLAGGGVNVTEFRETLAAFRTLFL